MKKKGGGARTFFDNKKSTKPDTGTPLFFHLVSFPPILKVVLVKNIAHTVFFL